MNCEFTYAPVRSVEKIQLKRAKRLYNFSVEENESYIAKGVVMHNCRCTIIAKI